MTLEEIKALPLINQIELMMDIANGKDFGNLTSVWCGELDLALAQLHRDATDQAAAENDALHGKEVSVLGAPWLSANGMTVGY